MSSFRRNSSVVASAGACPGRRAGLVVPPRGPRALAAAIHRVLEDGAPRREMGEAAYARAKSEFTLEHMREGTLAVYLSVTASKE